jgi:hypothetical protein
MTLRLWAQEILIFMDIKWRFYCIQKYIHCKYKQTTMVTDWKRMQTEEMKVLRSAKHYSKLE